MNILAGQVNVMCDEVVEKLNEVSKNNMNTFHGLKRIPEMMLF